MESVTWWCHDIEFFINPDKAHRLWCTLDKRPADKPMLAVTFDGAVAEGKGHLRYPGIHFKRMLTYREHVETTALKCKEGLSVLKVMVARGIY